MAYVYYNNLDVIFKKDPFVAERLVEWPGWKTNGRPPSTGGNEWRFVLTHHTACFNRVDHNPLNCVRSILNGRVDAPGPISQVLVTSRWPAPDGSGRILNTPKLVLLAAGRCNHAGAGTWPDGSTGNGFGMGFEACGPYEWTDEHIELYARSEACVLRYFGWGKEKTLTHHEYAPTRKIDASGKWLIQPNLALLNPWHGDLWRDHVDYYIRPHVPTPPKSSIIFPLEGNDVATLVYPPGGGFGVVGAFGRRYIKGPEDRANSEMYWLWANGEVKNSTPIPIPAEVWDGLPLQEETVEQA